MFPTADYSASRTCVRHFTHGPLKQNDSRSQGETCFVAWFHLGEIHFFARAFQGLFGGLSGTNKLGLY